MAKVIDVGLEEGYALQHSKSVTTKGNVYHFDRGVATEVKDKEDIEWFRKRGYKIVGIKDKLKEKVTGKTEIDKLKEKRKVLTSREAYALNKAEQRKLIQKLGGANHRIPLREKDRVALILKLQEEV